MLMPLLSKPILVSKPIMVTRMILIGMRMLKMKMIFCLCGKLRIRLRHVKTTQMKTTILIRHAKTTKMKTTILIIRQLVKMEYIGKLHPVNQRHKIRTKEVRKIEVLGRKRVVKKIGKTTIKTGK